MRKWLGRIRALVKPISKKPHNDNLEIEESPCEKSTLSFINNGLKYSFANTLALGYGKAKSHVSASLHNNVMNGQAKISEPRRLYQQVADQIRELIEGGEFLPGSRLPAERELAQKLGVSRPSLREALIALEIDGSVEIRMGSGVYVESISAPTRTKSLGESPSELMQARSAIEGATIILAASRIDNVSLASLRAVLDEMRREIAVGRKPLDQDRKFHTTIAEQSGNSVLTKLVADLFDERHSPISAQLRVKFEDKDTWTVALQEHEAILAALENRDPLQAQAAMHIHLDSSRRRWVEN